MSAEFRILIADDTPSLHEDFAQILVTSRSAYQASADLSDFLSTSGIELNLSTPTLTSPRYKLDHAYQGDEAIRLVHKSQEENDPYALIFMDVRMPPGLDGIETISRIWKINPDIEVVICTSFSDYSWENIIAQLGSTDKLMILKKPFDIIEVQQMALSLSTKWMLGKKNRECLQTLELEKQELAESRTRAQESSKIKSDFIAIISHELKTPLTAILGYTNLLLSADEKGGDEHDFKHDAVSRIDINAHKLNDLVKDILFISEIESGTIQCNTCTFYPMKAIDRILTGMEHLIRQKNLNIVCDYGDEDMHLYSDRIKFETIVTNLISNAIKFTDDGDIIIKTWSDDTLLYCSVTDTGIGIPMDKFEIVFEKFRQVDQSLTRKHSGTGLGLAIAMCMTQMLGGTIKLESVEGKGSTFTFSVLRDLNTANTTNTAP